MSGNGDDLDLRVLKLLEMFFQKFRADCSGSGRRVEQMHIQLYETAVKMRKDLEGGRQSNSNSKTHGWMSAMNAFRPGSRVFIGAGKEVWIFESITCGFDGVWANCKSLDGKRSCECSIEMVVEEPGSNDSETRGG